MKFSQQTWVNKQKGIWAIFKNQKIREYKQKTQYQFAKHFDRQQCFTSDTGFSGGPVSEESTCNARDCLQCRRQVIKTSVQYLGRKYPLDKEMTTHSSILAWEIPWTGEPGGLQPMGSQESDMTEETATTPLIYKCFRLNYFRSTGKQVGKFWYQPFLLRIPCILQRNKYLSNCSSSKE